MSKPLHMFADKCKSAAEISVLGTMQAEFDTLTATQKMHVLCDIMDAYEIEYSITTTVPTKRKARR